MGTVSLLEACRNSGGTVKSIVVSTSDKAFGHASVPYTEETPLNPLYTYETSKACQDFIGLSYYHNYDLPVKIVRCSNLYGPGDRNLSRIIPNTILSVIRNRAPILYEGVGEYQREFVYIEDACQAFELVSNSGSSGEAYCVGGAGVWYIKDLVKMITSLMSSSLEPVILAKASSFREIPLQYINAAKLNALGWTATTPLDTGLLKTIEYYKEFERTR
jgi:nucleoside-diphosphate-sugar epimerase